MPKTRVVNRAAQAMVMFVAAAVPLGDLCLTDSWPAMVLCGGGIALPSF